MKKLGNGTVLIKTKNLDQAKRLRKLSRLSADVAVEIFEHSKLNSSMGVVRARDFKHLLDEELLEELKDQKVSKIHRVTRMMNEKKIKVLPYVEEPMRCFKCLKFGHQKMRCNFAKEPVCGRCARPQHVDRQKNEKCTGDSYCVNCESDEHGSFDKRCMVYKKEFEIAKIKADERVTFGEAHKIYVQRVVQGGETLAGIIKNFVESRERK